MDTESRLATSQELSTTIRARIESGRYANGTRLPSERALAEEFGLNRRTVRRGLDELEREGLLMTDSTRGTVVVSPVRAAGPIGLCPDESLSRDDRLVAISAERVLIARGISRRLSQEGRDRSLVWCDGHARPESGWVPETNEVARLGVSGVILWPSLPSHDFQLHRLLRLRTAMPLVMLDRRVPGFECDFVGFADREVGRVLGRHLLSLGHRRFAFIGWAIPHTVHDRYLGLCEALDDAGCPLLPQNTLLLAQDGFHVESIAPFFQREQLPEAVVCANDILALGLVLWLRERGIRVPEEIAVVGVGDSMGNLLDTIGLTTVALPNEQVGWEAADVMLERFQSPLGVFAEPEDRRLPVRLVVRRTCGALSH